MYKTYLNIYKKEPCNIMEAAAIIMLWFIGGTFWGMLSGEIENK